MSLTSKYLPTSNNPSKLGENIEFDKQETLNMIVSGEVWLGLEKLHQLTSARDYKLQVKMKDWDDRTYIAVYDQFEVFDNPIQKTKQLF